MTTPKGEADCSAPEYRIEKVQDFLKVPADRMEECLTEFRDFLTTARSIKKMADELGKVIGSPPPETLVDAFIWIDDGVRKGTVRFTAENQDGE
jgi:hypothetical protein